MGCSTMSDVRGSAAKRRLISDNVANNEKPPLINS
jgi:hypothetical protein